MVLNNMDTWASYFIEETYDGKTGTLKNKFNITDSNKLKEIETIITVEKLAFLYLEPVQGNFDSEHLKEIHRRIFSEIYPFAGEFRICTLSMMEQFSDPREINENLKLTLEEMNNAFENVSSFDDFAFKLVNYYQQIIGIHPFREGNGRSIREFIREFVLEKSKNCSFGPLELDLTKIDEKKLLEGTQQSYIFPGYIESEFRRCLVKVENNKKK